MAMSDLTNLDDLVAVSKRTMVGRIGDPTTDLKGIAVLLASRASDYITGQTIYVDGVRSSW